MSFCVCTLGVVRHEQSGQLMLIRAHAECPHALAITFKMRVSHTAFIMCADVFIKTVLVLFLRDNITNNTTIELECLATRNRNDWLNFSTWKLSPKTCYGVIQSWVEPLKNPSCLAHGWCCCGLARFQHYISTNEQVPIKAGSSKLLPVSKFRPTYL